jgi:hypothetical protein
MPLQRLVTFDMASADIVFSECHLMMALQLVAAPEQPLYSPSTTTLLGRKILHPLRGCCSPVHLCPCR